MQEIVKKYTSSFYYIQLLRGVKDEKMVYYIRLLIGYLYRFYK